MNKKTPAQCSCSYEELTKRVTISGVKHNKNCPLGGSMKRVLTGGGFDILHLGHIRYLEEAKKYGDYLIVNVLSDARIRAKKGSHSAIMPEDDRCELVRALRCVDEVVCFKGDPDYPFFRLLEEVKFDVAVLNSDEYKTYQAELQACIAYGRQIHFIPRIHVESGVDKGEIIRRIKLT